MPGGVASREPRIVARNKLGGTMEHMLGVRQDTSSSTAPSTVSSRSGVSSPSSISSSASSTSSEPSRSSSPSSSPSTTSSHTSHSITDVLLPTGSATSSSSPSGRSPLPQTVLMWIFAVIALGVIGLIIIWRWSCVRRRRARQHARRRSSAGGDTDHVARGSSFSRHNSAHISDVHFHNSWDRHTQPITLSPTFLHTGLTMPLVDSQGNMIAPPRRMRDRRVQALDVDAGGRRGGRPIGDDGEQEDSDVFDQLPAYNEDKAPPEYQNPSLAHVGGLPVVGQHDDVRPGSRQQQHHRPYPTEDQDHIPMPGVRTTPSPGVASSSSSASMAAGRGYQHAALQTPPLGVEPPPFEAVVLRPSSLGSSRGPATSLPL